MSPLKNHLPLLPVRAGLAVVALVLAPAVVVSPAWAQGEPAYIGWTKVETARETREYKDKIRDGAALDAESRRFLQQTALPQLALEENLATIERTRRRMREVLLTEIDDDKAFADVSRLVAEFMTGLARDENAGVVARVNALLLVGELRSKDGKPWPPAQPLLAAAAADVKLPIAVRIAAVAGIGRHVDLYRADEQALAALAKAAGPATLAILSEPVTSDRRTEQEWLAARALTILPVVLRAAPKNVAATLAGIVEDPARATDVRVRAAAALGATANAKSEVNAAKVVEAIRGLAISALEADVMAADRRRFEQQYRGLVSGQQPGFPQPGGPGPGFPGPPTDFGMQAGGAAMDQLAIPEQACRRDAWRLVALADAIAASNGTTGLATLLGNAAGPATQLAAALRDGGMAIDQTPDESSVTAALAMLKAPATPAPTKPAAAAPQTEQPATEPAADPNASPFDSPFGQ
jgi:hypothetical protein